MYIGVIRGRTAFFRFMSDSSQIAAPPDFPPAWAGGWGEDARGIYAMLVVGGVSIELRWIPPGKFLMGSPETESGRYSDESPRHEVILSKGFWLASTPCTQSEYEAVTGQSPSRFKGPRRPVENVNWSEAREFCRKLTGLARQAGALATDFEFRLPTEAEWEHSCRAGTTTAFNSVPDTGSNNPTSTSSESSSSASENNDEVLGRLGWFTKNSGDETHPVAEKAPNRWGLYDMHGNVLELCLDGKRAYAAHEAVDPVGPEDDNAWRVVRGGSCWSDARNCRSACRFTNDPGFRNFYLGFRLAAGQPVGSGATGLKAGGADAPEPRDEAPAGRPEREA